MNFLVPAAFAFAAAIPVVIVFYLLKRKRSLRVVSSTLLWQKFLAETQANAPFQRLRHNWLLILQILLLALAVFALARPYFSGHAKSSALRVLVLDGSASMLATDEKPNRFEKARAEALKWVDSLSQDERMMILLAGAKAEVKQSPTTDRAALRRAIQSCQASDSPTRLAEALKTAAAFVFEKREEAEIVAGEIHLFSDGAAPDLVEMANKNLPLDYHRIGQGGNNLGVVGIDVRANPDNAKERAVYTKIANLSTNARQVDVELLLDGQAISMKPLDLGPTNSQPLVFTAPQSKDGVFTVRLSATDDLAADNQASIVSLLPVPVKVLLVTRGNRFLEKALRAAPNARITTVPQLTDPAAAFDIVVLDDIVPGVWPGANTLAIHVTRTNWFSAVSRVEAPAIVDWKNTHPLLRFVNFDNVRISESLGVKAPAWGVTLLEAQQTPLIVAGDIDQHRLVWLSFDPLQSEWPLRISYPIFIANTVEWLNPASSSAGQFTLRSGEPFRLALTQPVTSARVTRPDGSAKDLAFEKPTTELLFGDTTQQGTYRVRAGTNDLTFCVNLLDSIESDIQPRDELPMGRYGSVTATTVKRANLELWRWITLAGLAVLLFEWWWYHKRTA
ncbi:MAG: VWA domain-containing protein [Verrucomicrobia bacterium]|nr:VWA domain-containing protein [Verrucomicrobiota bacterium]